MKRVFFLCKILKMIYLRQTGAAEVFPATHDAIEGTPRFCVFFWSDFICSITIRLESLRK